MYGMNYGQMGRACCHPLSHRLLLMALVMASVSQLLLLLS